jgi:hypothetical protein
LEDDDAVDEPAAPLASMREERDLRLIGDELEGASEGELCLVLGADPLAKGEAAALISDGSLAAGDSPFCCACACCCLARAAAAADPGGGGILDPAEAAEEEGGSGLLSESLLRGFAQAPVMERFMMAKGASEASVQPEHRSKRVVRLKQVASSVL